MIGILGGMGTQAGLDFCNKLAILNRGKIDQKYPLFILYNKSNIPGRPESIGVQTGNLSNRITNKISEKKYSLVLKSLLNGCNVLKKSKCKFIVIPCNTAHYWYDDLKKKINYKTRAIMPVHLYGNPADMIGIKKVIKNRNIKLIEDCAQAHGTRIGKKHVGNFGEIGTFSFFPGKNLGAFGDGGAIITNSKKIAQYCLRYRNHGAP